MNKYIAKYQELRNQGCNELEAMGLASNYIAVTTGSIEDLEALYSYHLDDFMREINKTFNEVEETKNVRITSAV